MPSKAAQEAIDRLKAKLDATPAITPIEKLAAATRRARKVNSKLGTVVQQGQFTVVETTYKKGGHSDQKHIAGPFDIFSATAYMERVCAG